MDENKNKKPNHWVNIWEGIKSFSIMMGLIFFTIGKWMFHFTMFVGEIFADMFNDQKKKPNKRKKKKKRYTRQKKSL
jgi:hypothetical protein